MLTFPKGGAHPPELKEQTDQILATGAELKNTFCLTRDDFAFLSQHIGAPCTPTVARKEEIAEGALIGEVKRGLGVPLHSPVAGKVKAIGTSAHPMRVTAPSLTIGVDHEPITSRYLAA